MTRIALVISTLAAGGAERVAVTLCNAWAEAGHEVHLLTFESSETNPYYKLHSAIRLHSLNLLFPSSGILSFIRGNLVRIKTLRRELKRIEPDVTIAFMTETNVLTLLATRFLGHSVIVSERIHPGFHPISRITGLLRALTYRLADIVVVQNAEIAKWVTDHTGARTTVLPNPIDLNNGKWAGRVLSNEGERRIIAVGRLVHQKGFDLLLQAFASIATRHPQWRLTVFGDGPDRSALEGLAIDLGISEQAIFAGNTEQISHELRQADLFVHAARYEGYPNVVVEALASGLCVVATDCPGATPELLADGKYGLLVPPEDVAGLSKAMEMAMSDDALRARYASTARDAVQDLAAPRIAGRWIDLIDQLR